jgi:adenine-specific DNA-methyltransferase
MKPTEIEQIEVNIESKIPHLLKYMGSKREIIGFVTDAIKSLDVESTWVCDLFAGTGVVSGSIKSSYNIHANDIQAYSAILSNTYLSNLKGSIKPGRLDEIKAKAIGFAGEFFTKHPGLNFEYKDDNTLEEFIKLEKKQQALMDIDFNIGFHLFAKYYSGTYWSYNQCVWIDSLRAVAEQYKGKSEYYAILSSLIFAMSYVSQSTGHYAQYRDTTKDNMFDILSYRKRDILTYFERKFKELTLNLNGDATKEYKVTTLDYLDCLRIVEQGTIVYADPPYQSVHYSRFYHALETLVKYDYPKVLHKGRYIHQPNQSPFLKKTTVNQAFNDLYIAVKENKSHLVLSYSDTGMITLDQLTNLGINIFGNQYTVDVLEKDHIHSKMGRSDEKDQDVTEYIILFKRNNEFRD